MGSEDVVDLPLLASEAFVYGTVAPGTRATVCCCLCGAATQWNASSMCNQCLRSRVDITEGIERECTVQRCRGCGRYLDPPHHWVLCGLETKELMGVCLKRIRWLCSSFTVINSLRIPATGAPAAHISDRLAT